jgi:hypothetical protein
MNNKKKKSSNRLSTEMTSEKIKIIKDIDLNSIFKLNYNFDVLKGLIEHLLTNQQKLQNQIDEIYLKDGERDKNTSTILDDIKSIKENYIDKNFFNNTLNDINEFKNNIKLQEDKINECKLQYITIIIFSTRKIRNIK